MTLHGGLAIVVVLAAVIGICVIVIWAVMAPPRR
jgi:uncharacterized membrane protein YqjE